LWEKKQQFYVAKNCGVNSQLIIATRENENIDLSLTAMLSTGWHHNFNNNAG
jgi:hypothetical protein